MKKLLLFAACVLFTMISADVARACHAIALVSPLQQPLSNGTGIQVTASSDSPTCGCAVYWMDIEVRCNSSSDPFTGGPLQPGVWIPYNSYPFFQSQQMQKPNCVVQQYPWVTIPFSGLCPGVTYKYRMRENHNGQAGPWTATFTFTVPGVVSPLQVTASANPTSICGTQTVQLNSTITGGCSSNQVITWSGPGLSSTSVANPTATVSSTTTYTVTYQDLCSNQTASASVTITVAPPPVAGTASISPSTVCSGQSTTLTLTGYSTASTIQWQSSPTGAAPWTNIAGATTTPYTTGPITSTMYFQAVVTNACGTVTSNVVSVTVTSSITVTATASPATICAGASSTLTATGASNYVWQPGNLNGTSVVVTPAVTTTYSVTGTTTGGCQGTASVTVTVLSSATLTTTQSNVLCNGGNTGTATVNPSGGVGPYQYSWNTTPVQNTQTATGLTAGTYIVTVSTANSCTSSATVVITQPTALTASATSTPSTCNLSNGTATANPLGGTGTYSYSWNTNPVQNTQTATGLQQGTYIVTITDQNGCTVTASATVGLNNAGSASISSSTNVTCFNACNGSATVTMTGGQAPFTYSWNTSPVQTTATATQLCAGNYIVTVTDANGCIATAPVTITQPPLLTSSITASVNVSCFGGNNGSATVSAAGGTPGYLYSWSPSGGANATATGLVAGTYIVTVTDQNNCTSTSNVTITQPPLLTLSAAGFDATCNGACDGQAVVIPSGGTQPYSYAWSPGGCNTPSCNNLCAGTFSVVVTDAMGCTATDTANVNEPPALVLTTSSSTAHCNLPDGQAWVTVSGGTPGYNYLWNSNPPQLSDTAFAIVPGPYVVTVSDFNNCVATASVTVANAPGVVASITGSVNATCNGSCNGSATALATGGIAPYTYQWNSSPVQNTATATNLCAGSYIVTITDASGCTSTASVTITEPSAVVAAPNTPPPLCIGQCATLTSGAAGGTSPYTYAWSSGSNVCPTVTTSYSVVATDLNGCASAPAQVTVTVNPPLNVVAAGTSGICPGAQAQLGATGSGGNGGPYSYSWSPAAGLSNPNINNPSASAAATTTYTVYVTDQCGTPVDSDMVTITVHPLPSVAITSDITAACDTPGCISFTDLSTIVSGSVAGWAWDFGDLGTSSQQDPSYCYNGPGTYQVSLTATSDQGCQSTLAVPYPITIYPQPVADFTFGPQPATIVNPKICFTDASLYADTWSWDFGDPSDITSSNAQNPCHIYSDSGTYCVDLVVTTTYGCHDDTTYCLVIGPDFTIYIPNAFSPNGDNINDNFVPQGIGIDETSFELFIFDRWGNLIYSTQNYNKGWDGRAHYGKDVAQEDVYVWKIVVKDIMKNKHEYMGHVTLVK